jgi:ABC-type phosphate/phosphonate transport system permease subunit
MTPTNPVYRRRLLGTASASRCRCWRWRSAWPSWPGSCGPCWPTASARSRPSLFTGDTPAPGGEGGGLRNAIVGSLMMVGLSTLVSTPIGILAGIYLAEYGATNRFGQVTRFVTDIMLSAPSIVIGLFVYALYTWPTPSTSRAMPARSRCR